MTAPLAEGTLFAGDYRIVRLLRAGGMGAVYVVDQESTGKPRALKVMRPELVANDALRKRFEQEARVGGRIESEHVVEVQRAGVDAATGVPYLVMELLRGKDLGDAMAARGAFSTLEVRMLMEELCHAVGAAHAAGIVHRDLKPENIFLAETRRAGQAFTVKVLDFGIAKLAAEAGEKTAAIGSPLWMAPEQTEVGTITPAADVWSIGLLAFQLLTGVAYWRVLDKGSPSVQQLLRVVLFEPLPGALLRASERGVQGLVPEGFDAWFARAVTRDVTARFPDARAAFAAIDPILRASSRSAASATSAPEASLIATAPATSIATSFELPAFERTAPAPAPLPSPPAASVASVAVSALTPPPAARTLPSEVDGARVKRGWLLPLGGMVALIGAIGGGGFLWKRAADAKDPELWLAARAKNPPSAITVPSDITLPAAPLGEPPSPADLVLDLSKKELRFDGYPGEPLLGAADPRTGYEAQEGPDGGTTILLPSLVPTIASARKYPALAGRPARLTLLADAALPMRALLGVVNTAESVSWEVQLGVLRDGKLAAFKLPSELPGAMTGLVLLAKGGLSFTNVGMTIAVTPDFAGYGAGPTVARKGDGYDLAALDDGIAKLRNLKGGAFVLGVAAQPEIPLGAVVSVLGSLDTLTHAWQLGMTTSDLHPSDGGIADGGIPPPDDVAAPPPNAITTASGLAYRVLRAGKGMTHPGPKSMVTVQYTGWTTEGHSFDTSATRGPASFELDAVIPGWTEALELMVVGEKVRLWVPPKLAYGDKARNGAPPGTLVFDVELISFTAPPKPKDPPAPKAPL